MRLNRFNNINAPVPLVRDGDALRRDLTIAGASTTAFSSKGNSFLFKRNRYLTKVRGNFQTSGQNLNIVVCSILNATATGNIVQVLLDGESFVTTTGYQEITLATPILLISGTRYIIFFRRPDGAALRMSFRTGNAATDTGEAVTSAYVRSNAVPAPGQNMIDDSGSDVWVIEPTTEAASPSPSNPIPASSTTKLLCQFDGPDASLVFRDETGKTMTAVGNAQIKNDQFKFINSSGRFDGTGDRVTLADSTDWDLGTSSYTIEMFVRLNSKTTNQTFITHRDTTVATSQFAFFLDGSTLKMRLSYGGSEVDIGATWTPTLATWYHLCVDRDGLGVTRVYVGGVIIASDSTQSAAPNSCSAPLVIGARGNADAFPTFDFNGWMDHLRFSKVAKYAGGFTPPARPFYVR